MEAEKVYENGPDPFFFNIMGTRMFQIRVEKPI